MHCSKAVRIMANRAKRPCSYPGCPELTTERFCPTHKKQDDLRRGSAVERGYDARWRKARTHFLTQNPLCVHCLKEGRVTAATVVDHIKPHKGNRILFWDRTNWQALCKKHHDQKTAREDGGFGR